MIITVGNYEIEIDSKNPNFDPLKQNNASSTKIHIDGEDVRVGFIYNSVYRQKEAFEYSLARVREQYPTSKVYVVSDGGLDYSYLEDEYEDLKFEMGEDTIGPYTKMTFHNYLEPDNQLAIKKNIAATIERVFNTAVILT